QSIILAAHELLADNCFNIVFRQANRRGSRRADVFVKLESHALFPRAISKYRSRLISAPYAMQANRSSRWSCGYSASNSSNDSPSANKSRINDTHRRVPRTHGLP